MTTFQEHFTRLQEIHNSLSQNAIDIDQAILLQKEAEEHVHICKTILHRYETDMPPLSFGNISDKPSQNVLPS